MNFEGLKRVNSETGNAKEIKTTGNAPQPNTLFHTSNIKGNKMLVYGGCFEEEENKKIYN